DDHVQVTARPAVRSRLALAGDRDVLPGAYAVRDLHVQHALLRLAARALAVGALLAEELAAAAALGAGGDHAEEPAALHDLPAAAAGLARLGLGARLGAGAGAGGAEILAGELDVALDAGQHFLK